MVTVTNSLNKNSTDFSLTGTLFAPPNSAHANLFVNATFAYAAAGATPALYGVFASNTFTANSGVAYTSVAGLYSAITTATSGSGTITNAYGAFINLPAVSLGTPSLLAGVAVGGSVSTLGANGYGILVNPLASGSLNTFIGENISPTFATGATITSIYGSYINYLASKMSVTSLWGQYIFVGGTATNNPSTSIIGSQITGSIASTVTNVYGLYINPAFTSGTVTTFTGIAVQPSILSTFNAINNLYGLNISFFCQAVVSNVTGANIGMSLVNVSAFPTNNFTGLSVQPNALTSVTNYFGISLIGTVSAGSNVYGLYVNTVSATPISGPYLTWYGSYLATTTPTGAGVSSFWGQYINATMGQNPSYLGVEASYYGMQLTGTMAASVNFAFGMTIQTAIQGYVGQYVYGLYINPTFAPTAPYSTFAVYGSNITYTMVGTATFVFGEYISINQGAGSTTSMYGLYVNSPTGAALNTTAYFAGSGLIAFGTVPNISQYMGIGAAITNLATLTGVEIAPQMAYVGSSTTSIPNSFLEQITGVFIPTSSSGIVTIQNAYGLYINPTAISVQANGGSVVNLYGLYVAQPGGSAASAVSAYFAGSVTFAGPVNFATPLSFTSLALTGTMTTAPTGNADLYAAATFAYTAGGSYNAYGIAAQNAITVNAGVAFSTIAGLYSSLTATTTGSGTISNAYGALINIPSITTSATLSNLAGITVGGTVSSPTNVFYGELINPLINNIAVPLVYGLQIAPTINGAGANIASALFGLSVAPIFNSFSNTISEVCGISVNFTVLSSITSTVYGAVIGPTLQASNVTTPFFTGIAVQPINQSAVTTYYGIYNLIGVSALAQNVFGSYTTFSFITAANATISNLYGSYLSLSTNSGSGATPVSTLWGQYINATLSATGGGFVTNNYYGLQVTGQISSTVSFAYGVNINPTVSGNIIGNFYGQNISPSFSPSGNYTINSVTGASVNFSTAGTINYVNGLSITASLSASNNAPVGQWVGLSVTGSLNATVSAVFGLQINPQLNANIFPSGSFIAEEINPSINPGNFTIANVFGSYMPFSVTGSVSQFIGQFISVVLNNSNSVFVTPLFAGQLINISGESPVQNFYGQLITSSVTATVTGAFYGQAITPFINSPLFYNNTLPLVYGSYIAFTTAGSVNAIWGQYIGVTLSNSSSNFFASQYFGLQIAGTVASAVFNAFGLSINPNISAQVTNVYGQYINLTFTPSSNYLIQNVYGSDISFTMNGSVNSLTGVNINMNLGAQNRSTSFWQAIAINGILSATVSNIYGLYMGTQVNAAATTFSAIYLNPTLAFVNTTVSSVYGLNASFLNEGQTNNTWGAYLAPGYNNIFGSNTAFVANSLIGLEIAAYNVTPVVNYYGILIDPQIASTVTNFAGINIAPQFLPSNNSTLLNAYGTEINYATSGSVTNIWGDFIGVNVNSGNNYRATNFFGVQIAGTVSSTVTNVYGQYISTNINASVPVYYGQLIAPSFLPGGNYRISSIIGSYINFSPVGTLSYLVGLAVNLGLTPNNNSSSALWAGIELFGSIAGTVQYVYGLYMEPIIQPTANIFDGGFYAGISHTPIFNQPTIGNFTTAAIYGALHNFTSAGSVQFLCGEYINVTMNSGNNYLASTYAGMQIAGGISSSVTTAYGIAINPNLNAYASFFAGIDISPTFTPSGNYQLGNVYGSYINFTTVGTISNLVGEYINVNYATAGISTLFNYYGLQIQGSIGLDTLYVYSLYINTAINTVVGMYAGEFIAPTFNPSSNYTSYSVYGTNITYSAVGSITNVWGQYIDVVLQSNNNFTTASYYGVQISGGVSSSVSNAYGLSINSIISAPVTAAYTALNIAPVFIPNGNYTLTNVYGSYIAFAGVGSMTNLFGEYIKVQPQGPGSPTNVYGFYISSVPSPSSATYYTAILGDNSGSASGIEFTKVGVGLNTPTYTLQLGNDNAAKTLTNTWIISSDKRIKRNIEDITDALSIIRKLKPRKYQLHPDYALDAHTSADSTRYGFVADEVEEVLEGCVVENPHQNVYGGKLNEWKALSDEERENTPQPKPTIRAIKGFNIHNILVHGIQAIRELADQNDACTLKQAALEKQLADGATANSALQQKLELLEKKLDAILKI